MFELLLASLIGWQPSPANLRELFEQRLTRAERAQQINDAGIASAARDLGLFLREQGDRDGARTALGRALEMDRAAGDAGKQEFADAADLASVSPPAEAEVLWTRASASPDASLAALALASLGELREAAGDRAGAAAFYRKALAKEELAGGVTGARIAVRLNSLALVEEPPAAVRLLERALAIDRRVWGERHPETATTEANLCGELLASGRVREAVSMGTQALKNFEATMGADHPRTGAAASTLADSLAASGDKTGAEKLYRRALTIDERAYGPAHPETLGDVKNLVDFLNDSGRTQEASELARRLAR